MPLPEPKFYLPPASRVSTPGRGAAWSVVEQPIARCPGRGPQAAHGLSYLAGSGRGPWSPINESTTSADYQGGLQRDVALRRFLAACESSAVVPDDIRDETRLSASAAKSWWGDHIPKDKAREIVAAIDQMTPPLARKGDGEPGTASTETVADPVGLSNAFAKWFLHNWKVISIEVEDAATQALIRLGLGLQHAAERRRSHRGGAGFPERDQGLCAGIRTDCELRVAAAWAVVGSDAIEVNTQSILATLRKHPVVGPALAAPAQVLEIAPAPVDRAGAAPAD